MAVSPNVIYTDVYPNDTREDAEFLAVFSAPANSLHHLEIGGTVDSYHDDPADWFSVELKDGAFATAYLTVSIDYGGNWANYLDGNPFYSISISVSTDGALGTQSIETTYSVGPDYSIYEDFYELFAPYLPGGLGAGTAEEYEIYTAILNFYEGDPTQNEAYAKLNALEERVDTANSPIDDVFRDALHLLSINIAEAYVPEITTNGVPVPASNELFPEEITLKGPVTDGIGFVKVTGLFQIGSFSGGDTQFVPAPYQIDIGLVPISDDSDSAVIVGDSGDNVLRGTRFDDKIVGYRGDDRLFGFAGDDTLLGGPGDDRLVGGPGKDNLFGGPGNDIIFGNDGNDRLVGDAGDDRIFGGNGNDRLIGGSGSDRLVGGNGRDILVGGPGDDILFGNNGNDRLSGGAGNDRLFGGPGDDRLIGGAGRDILDGGPGNDAMFGGRGPDVFVFRAGHDTILDFSRGDRIDLRSINSINSLRDIALNSSANDEGLLISVGRHSLLLTDIEFQELRAVDFLF
ncbi:hypothetical protein L1787_00195 [Acuticoccus sp. M5D2P5]|uniref:calcium-binding protein n=1 Tax=Acuticoccus kalidii TaxID=2910977 RepID=UPI001F47ABB0|nr:hypothetical protein [Acuticoccus kalidii]